MKKCSKCLLNKDESEFNKKTKKLFQPYCKSCQKVYHSEYYNNNKSNYAKKNKKLKRRNVEFIYNYLLSHPCIDCKESDPIVLDFDHQGNKFKNVTLMALQTYSLEQLKDEISKCEVRCSNCHRRKTAKERDYFRYHRGVVQ
jgi:hypothetical protein